MWHTLRLFTISSAVKRTKYYREKNIFHSMGANCLIMNRKVPLYAKLISIGDNVRIASGVHFITHDITHLMINRMNTPQNKIDDKKYSEKVGCIEIGDNVFIGSGTYIMYNVRIGSNVIVGTGSLVNKDVPDNCVVAGVPARIIETFDEYIEKRDKDEAINGVGNEAVTPEAEQKLWEQFLEKRDKRLCF